MCNILNWNPTSPSISSYCNTAALWWLCLWCLIQTCQAGRNLQTALFHQIYKNTKVPFPHHLVTSLEDKVVPKKLKKCSCYVIDVNRYQTDCVTEMSHWPWKICHGSELVNVCAKKFWLVEISIFTCSKLIKATCIF